MHDNPAPKTPPPTPNDPDRTRIRPTRETYEQLQQAFDTLNRALFDNELPNCLITLQRRKKSFGYFSSARFGRADGTPADEIALNPMHFRDRPVEDVLATLAHEMTHLWQQHFGWPGRGRYHNRQWAERMKAIGLKPTDTGDEDGKEIGESVSQIIIADGPFAKAVARLVAKGFELTWTENPDESDDDDNAGESGAKRKKSKNGVRMKFTCPVCQLNAWAKPDAKLACGEHMELMVAGTEDES